MTYKLVWKKCLLQGALFNLSLNFLIINLPVSFVKPLSAPRNVADDDKNIYWRLYLRLKRHHWLIWLVQKKWTRKKWNKLKSFYGERKKRNRFLCAGQQGMWRLSLTSPAWNIQSLPIKYLTVESPPSSIWEMVFFISDGGWRQSNISDKHLCSLRGNSWRCTLKANKAQKKTLQEDSYYHYHSCKMLSLTLV